MKRYERQRREAIGGLGYVLLKKVLKTDGKYRMMVNFQRQDYVLNYFNHV